MREQGRLIQWDDNKGYGFITPDGGGPKIFVHIKAFALSAGRPQSGELVSYEAGQDGQGKRRALNVRRVAVPVAAKPAPAPARRSSADASVWLVPAFAAYYLAIDLLWPMRPAVWGAYSAMSLATFIVYWGDKRASRRPNAARVAERTLHLLALACGWPGALLARQTLRHKSSKASFTRVFWLTVLANVAAFTLLFTPLRAHLL